MRAVNKLKLVHVKLISGLHHEGIAAADQFSTDARDVSKLPRGALAGANIYRAGGAYDWYAAQYGSRDKLVTAEIKRSLADARRYSSRLGIIDQLVELLK